MATSEEFERLAACFAKELYRLREQDLKAFNRRAWVTGEIDPARVAAVEARFALSQSFDRVPNLVTPPDYLPGEKGGIQ